MATDNPLVHVHQFGQSVWLDLLSRNLIRSGKLKRLIDEDAVTGVTSNPAIFEKAIGGTDDYDNDIRSLAETGKSPGEIYRSLSIRDIQETADLLRPVYVQTNRKDGYVSLEVSPMLAHDWRGTVREANELWKALGRPNAMIKIPA